MRTRILDLVEEEGELGEGAIMRESPLLDKNDQGPQRGAN